LKEAARLGTSPNALTIISSEEMKFNMGGAEYSIPENTGLINLSMVINRDPNVFGGPEKSQEYANTFHPDRENLDQIVNWNGLERYVAAHNSERAPRYCPGHDMAFFMCEAIVNRFKPYSLPSDQSKALSSDQEQLLDDHEEQFNIAAKQIQDGTPLQTKVSLIAAKVFLENWTSLSPKDIKVPTEEPHKLETVECGGYVLPVEDEDLKYTLKDYQNMLAGKMLSLHLFEVEDLERNMKDPSEGHELREQLFGDLWPTPNVKWKEFSSDEAQSLMVFYGPGLVYTSRCKADEKEKEQEHIPKDTYWICDVSYLSIFEVRAGFEIFGHTAYFNKNREIIGIYSCQENRYIPKYETSENNEERKKHWEHTKFGWRCSLGVSLTMNDHLLKCHWMVSNAFERATRETLPCDHPMRRFNAIFTFRTAFVNYLAKDYLINKNGIVHRAFAFPYDEVIKIIHFVNNAYRFECLPDKWKHNGVDELTDKECPVYHDSMALWKILNEFFVKYVKIYYNNDTASFMNDPYIIKFQRNLYSNLGIAPKVYAESFEHFSNVYTQLLVEITGMHEFVGNLIEFKTRPDGYCGKVRTNLIAMGDVQAYLQLLILGALTGARVPALLGNFTHLILQNDRQQEVYSLFESWQQQLYNLSQSIERKNADSNQRIQPFVAFSPAFLECSVSI